MNGCEPKQEDIPRWVTCIPCDVQWKDVDWPSECFVCGKTGIRGQLGQVW